MKNQTKVLSTLKYICMLSIVFSIFSCEDFDEINTDPNEPILVPASNLLTQAQFTLYNQLASRIQNAEWSLLMVQHWTQNEYASEARYDIDATQFNFTWQTYYASIISELEAAKTLVNEAPNAPTTKANQIAIIDIMIVQAYQALTEMFGDIPYTEANIETNAFPIYDKQQVIWTGLLSTLDGAVSSISGDASFEEGDIVFGANSAQQWKKLGASILLKMAMRVSDVAPELTTQYAAKANSYGFITSDALFVFDSSNPNTSNPLWFDANVGTNGPRDDFSMCCTFTDKLIELNDPRLDFFAAPNPAGNIGCIPPGAHDAIVSTLKPNSSRPTDIVRGPDTPHPIMTVAEIQFFLAEAYERGILSGDAGAAFNAAITASMNQWGISDQAAIDAYIAANPYDAANWKASIGLQKWIALHINGPEAWSEFRRLDQPQLPIPEAAVKSSIPVRVYYPLSEYATNEAELNKAKATVSDELTTKLWWDVN